MNASLPSTSHVYQNSGIYDVSLEVTDGNGCQDFILIDSMIWVSNLPVVSVSNNLNMIIDCDTPMTVQFNSTVYSTSVIADSLFYLWNFDNGTTSELIGDSAEFYPGIYHVTFTANDEYGCETSAIQTIQIINPVANFDLLNSFDYTVCDTAIFNNMSNSGMAFWDYGDGTSGYGVIHIYPNPGVYNVGLTITSGNCVADTVIPVTVEEVIANFGFDSLYTCNTPFPVQFTDSSINAAAWLYDFGDSTSGGQQHPLHFYENPFSGLYDIPEPVYFQPSLIAYSSHGCSDYIISDDSILMDVPVAWFMPNINVGSAPLTVNFTDSSYSLGGNESGLVAYWNFDDGTDTITNTGFVTHTFTQNGIFQVTLTITNDLGCSDVSYPITILVYPGGT